MTNLTTAVGRAIKARRAQAGMTQAQLAEKVGLSEQALSKIERGDNAPLLATLGKIADALGAAPRDLLPPAPASASDPIAARIAARVAELSPTDQAWVEDILTIALRDRAR